LFKKLFIITMLSLYAFAIPADIQFSDLELSSADMLHFNIKVDNPGYGTYKTLMLSDIKSGNIKQLTFFPEKIMYLEDTGQFQIQNRFGIFRTDANLTNFTPIEQFSTFTRTFRLERGKIYPIYCSPDGKYLTYIKAKNNTQGNLTLLNISTQKEIMISENIELSLSKEIALWSDDSKFLIYTKEGAIYYYSIEHLNANRVFTESLRKIGQGILSNVAWGLKNDLYYVSEFLIYKIGSREFFTRALYKDILRIGLILGKIPFNFDPNFDSFWISPDGSKILLSKAGRNIFLYFLNSEDYITTGDIQSLPYLYLPRNTSIAKVIWSEDDQVTILTRSIEKGMKKSILFRMNIPKAGTIAGFTQTADVQVNDIILSPNNQNIAILKDNVVEIKAYSSWKTLYSINHPAPLAAIWKSDTLLFISGSAYTELYDTTEKKSSLITLSQGSEKGYSEDEKAIILKTNNQAYKLDLEKNSWAKTDNYAVKEPGVVSTSYRAYLTDSTISGYNNMIMIRNIKADIFGTTPLFSIALNNQFEAMPEKEEKIDFDNFTHGSRVRAREIALTFDVVDSIEGIPTILNVLSDYKIKCTFFINGEAIKRYAGAVKEITDSGQEIGSLFYAYFNMIDSKYNLDKNFIKLGLAINEDDYFNATGKELSLLWHAPYYFINSDITSASRDMGYIYIGRDMDVMDWVTRDISGYTTGIYLPAIKLVERILKEKKPGSIISMAAGIPKGEREDYLFQKLDILINALLNLGYSIVPVSTLIEHAK